MTQQIAPDTSWEQVERQFDDLTWDPEMIREGRAPSEHAIADAGAILEECRKAGMIPFTVVPETDDGGGIAIAFASHDRDVRIVCHNHGPRTIVYHQDGHSIPKVLGITAYPPMAIIGILDKIRRFLAGKPINDAAAAGPWEPIEDCPLGERVLLSDDDGTQTTIGKRHIDDTNPLLDSLVVNDHFPVGTFSGIYTRFARINPPERRTDCAKK